MCSIFLCSQIFKSIYRQVFNSDQHELLAVNESAMEWVLSEHRSLRFPRPHLLYVSFDVILYTAPPLSWEGRGRLLFSPGPTASKLSICRTQRRPSSLWLGGKLVGRRQRNKALPTDWVCSGVSQRDSCNKQQ